MGRINVTIRIFAGTLVPNFRSALGELGEAGGIRARRRLGKAALPRRAGKRTSALASRLADLPLTLQRKAGASLAAPPSSRGQRRDAAASAKERAFALKVEARAHTHDAVTDPLAARSKPETQRKLPFTIPSRPFGYDQV